MRLLHIVMVVQNLVVSAISTANCRGSHESSSCFLLFPSRVSKERIERPAQGPGLSKGDRAGHTLAKGLQHKVNRVNSR